MKSIVTLLVVLSISYSCSSLQRDPAQFEISKETKQECVEKVRPEYNSYFDQVEKCVQP
ncbi:MAG: hypothetical protein L6Q33_13135 [Bacteriovoracaceae bacterium]|jgi:hypothetical protein|nr:hypothetical protein [Bacteriovoracaceae bacterium]